MRPKFPVFMLDLEVNTAGRLRWDDLLYGFFAGTQAKDLSQIAIAACGPDEVNDVMSEGWSKLVPGGVLFLECDAEFQPRVNPTDWADGVIYKSQPGQPHYLAAVKTNK
jgi:hypothetical protein